MGRPAGLGGAAAAALLLALLRCGSAASVARRDRPAGRNDRPIIGILSQECHFDEYQQFGRSYIAASYVKFVESAGARAVPISPGIQGMKEGYQYSFQKTKSSSIQTMGHYLFVFWLFGGKLAELNLTDEEYDKLFHSINGILLPGGGVDLRTSEYSRVAKMFYHKALEANDKGDYFPIWGTCLGHEELTYLTSGEILLVHTKTNGFSLPLNFTSAAKDSRMFRNFPDDVLYALATEPLTSNFHVWSLSMENFTNNAKLRNFYKVLTTNTDDEVEFISTMEAYKYPIYGMQWHPEKNPFEWKDSPGIPHSPSAVRAAYYMADFFVNEARKSMHHFSSEEEEAKELIYNYNPVYTGKFSAFQQTYFFD